MIDTPISHIVRFLLQYDRDKQTMAIIHSKLKVSSIFLDKHETQNIRNEMEIILIQHAVIKTDVMSTVYPERAIRT